MKIVYQCINHKDIGMAILNEIIKVWMYTLGSFNDNKTQRYDGIICVLRTCILLSYLTTNVVICAGVLRHWNDNINVSSSDTILIKK